MNTLKFLKLSVVVMLLSISHLIVASHWFNQEGLINSLFLFLAFLNIGMLATLFVLTSRYYVQEDLIKKIKNDIKVVFNVLLGFVGSAYLLYLFLILVYLYIAQF